MSLLGLVAQDRWWWVWSRAIHTQLFPQSQVRSRTALVLLNLVLRVFLNNHDPRLLFIHSKGAITLASRTSNRRQPAVVVVVMDLRSLEGMQQTVLVDHESVLLCMHNLDGPRRLYHTWSTLLNSMRVRPLLDRRDPPLWACNLLDSTWRRWVRIQPFKRRRKCMRSSSIEVLRLNELRTRFFARVSFLIVFGSA